MIYRIKGGGQVQESENALMYGCVSARDACVITHAHLSVYIHMRVHANVSVYMFDEFCKHNGHIPVKKKKRRYSMAKSSVSK